MISRDVPVWTGDDAVLQVDHDPSGLRVERRNCHGVVLFHAYDDLASSVSFFQVRNRRGHLAQLVTPVNDRYNLSGQHEFAQDRQVFRLQFRQNWLELLAHERLQHDCLERGNEKPYPLTVTGSSDDDADAIGG
jgi:hypothetical protein